MSDGFIIRSTPAWLDQHQIWISDGARKLYKTLRTLADAKTGKLFIPGRGWIRLSTIEQKAGMSDETRKKYQRQLLALGAISVHHDRVTRTIDGRKRQVLGHSQITVLPINPPNPHGYKRSSTAKTEENVKPPHKQRGSSTANSSTAKGENGLLRLNSSAAQEFSRQYSSETTNKANGSALPSSEGSSRERISSSSKSTSPADDGNTDALKINPELRRWATKRILDRARGTVHDKHAYIRKALPEFLGNLAVEVEEYFEEQTIHFLQSYLRDMKPDQVFPLDPIYDFLEKKASEHCFPGMPGVIARAVESAINLTGLTIRPLPKN